MRTLFVTGGSGFVGRRLLAGIAAGHYDRVVALSRRENGPAPGVTWMRGELADPAPWRSALSKDTDVIHLAAATGAAGASEHRAVNALGTETLVRACERAGAGGLLFVSSIAARFPESRWYPYASAKREAEAIVRGGRIPFSIVRPTIVLGNGSPILQKLQALSGGAAVVVIGNGAARVQPVDVTDLAAMLVELLAQRTFDGSIREIGGPEVVTMESLLQRLRGAMGKPPARTIRLPYGLLRSGLITLEAVLGKHAPVTAGQLTSFVQDGVAQPCDIWERRRGMLRSIEQMTGSAA